MEGGGIIAEASGMGATDGARAGGTGGMALAIERILSELSALFCSLIFAAWSADSTSDFAVWDADSNSFDGVEGGSMRKGLAASFSIRSVIGALDSNM
jgi:hypothetical protein